MHEHLHQGTAQNHVEQIDHPVGRTHITEEEVVNHPAHQHKGHTQDHALVLAEQKVGQNRHHQHPDKSRNGGLWQQQDDDEKRKQRHQIGVDPLLQVSRGFQTKNAVEKQPTGQQLDQRHPWITVEKLQTGKNDQRRASHQKQQPGKRATVVIPES